MLRQHGADAEVEAARKADLMLDRGDRDGQVVWLRIRRAIVACAGHLRIAATRARSYNRLLPAIPWTDPEIEVLLRARSKAAAKRILQAGNKGADKEEGQSCHQYRSRHPPAPVEPHGDCAVDTEEGHKRVEHDAESEAVNMTA